MIEVDKNRVISITEKAIAKEDSLRKACKKAGQIKPDGVVYTPQGIRSETYSDKKWEEKTKPLKELEKLIAAIDKAIGGGLFVDFLELEKLVA